jgi:LacI family transcriptional regulator
VTIRQVADLAGVSIATVSRVLNGHTDVSDRTREMVQRVIRERGYRANLRSRAVPTGRVGVAVPMVHPGYFAQILSGAAEALYEHDMRVVLCPTRHSLTREMSLLDRLSDGEADGAVLVLPEESSEELGMLAEHGLPFVVVDPRTQVADGIPIVCAAHSSGAAQATRHLLDLGHRRIGVIGGPRGWIATEERLRGHFAALAARGVLPDSSYVRYANFRIDAGLAAATELLDLPSPPTAIFAFNDGMAIGAVQAAAQRGLQVPRDFSVVGFDDTVEAAISAPALTTVRQPLAELGRTAVSLLLRQLQNRRLEPLRVELETKLVVRDSTAPPTAAPSLHRYPAGPGFPAPGCSWAPRRGWSWVPRPAVGPGFPGPSCTWAPCRITRRPICPSLTGIARTVGRRGGLSRTVTPPFRGGNRPRCSERLRPMFRAAAAPACASGTCSRPGAPGRKPAESSDPLPGLDEDVAQDALDLVEVLLAADQRRGELDDRVAAVVGAAYQPGVE